ncbi:PIG-L family deacetylase [Peterkaempfera bronchialis]|uniref:PIG-L family deacetylase n=1 Tax=Peterkaempfera bronchialis TaxID=2126346 RepID=A0A345SYE8_9ACTN|nr:PIG-L family deacetylase [Peterkaempfera bronchialis]AXI78753.1 PIG-L family deacetylase [Peterkaempfera bronchialis]
MAASGRLSTGIPRRAVLWVTGALALPTVGGSVAHPPGGGPAPLPSGPGATPFAHRPAGAATTLQIVAHPDDDLYFMNPDIQQSIADGAQVVTVYVTAGDASGANRVPGRPRPRRDQHAYSAARHQGLRQAYALMAGARLFAPWQRSVLTLPDGHRAEVDQLADQPGVTLVFLNLAMYSDPMTPHSITLRDLWHRPGTVVRTRVATGSPVTTPQTYTRDELIGTLVLVLDHYRPALVRTMDPDPDEQVHDATHARAADQPGYSDHADHTAAGLFTWAALARWGADGGLATGYRGYYNHRWPSGLSPQARAAKRTWLDAYGGDPGWTCGDPSGCGDYEVGHGGSDVNRWPWSTTYRWAGPQPWAAFDTDGRLTVFAVRGCRLVMWREEAPGSGRFPPPADLGGAPLAPSVGAVLQPDGCWLVFAERFSGLDADNDGDTRETVLLEQRAPDGPFHAWRGLGNPRPQPVRGRRTGPPTAVRTPDGRVHLLVRNADKGLSTRVRSPGGSWGGWTELGGAEVQEGLAAVVDPGGLLQLFAAGRDGVHHWAQQSPGGPVRASGPTGLPAPGTPPAAALAPDGTVRVAYRLPLTAEFAVYAWDGGPARREDPGLSPGGHGPVALVPAADGLLLAARNRGGGLGAALLRPGTETAARWQSLGGVLASHPAAATDPWGRSVLVCFGLDGRLRISRAAGPRADRFGRWEPVER